MWVARCVARSGSKASGKLPAVRMNSGQRLSPAVARAQSRKNERPGAHFGTSCIQRHQADWHVLTRVPRASAHAWSHGRTCPATRASSSRYSSRCAPPASAKRSSAQRAAHTPRRISARDALSPRLLGDLLSSTCPLARMMDVLDAMRLLCEPSPRRQRVGHRFQLVETEGNLVVDKA